MFFSQLYPICSTATLLMTISSDEKTGMMTINLTPKPKKDAGEAALSRPLTLTATPEEFDANFIEALQKYQAARVTLADQVDATTEVLEAAKAAQAAKARKATTSASKPTPAKGSAPAPESDNDNGDDDSTGAAGPAPAPTPDAGVPSLF